MARICILIILFLALTAAAAQAGWTPAIRISQRGVFDRPKILAQGDTLHVIGEMASPDRFIRYLKSTDAGENWSNPFIIPNIDSSYGSLNESFVKDGNNLYICWENLSRHGAYNQNIGFRRSTNSGQSWRPPQLVLSQNRDIIGVPVMGKARSFLYVLYNESTINGLPFYIVKSSDGGQTWGNPHQMFVGGFIGSMKTVAVGDTIHLLWSGEIVHSGPWQVWYIRSTDGGTTWSENYNIRNTDFSAGDHASISANQRGDLISCWKDFRFSPYGTTGDIFYRISQNQGLTWESEVQLTDLHLSMSSSIKWDSDNIFLAYEDLRFDNQKDILFRKSSDNGVSWSEEERLTEDSYDSRDPNIEVSNDRIYLVWSSIDEVGWDTSQFSGVFFRKYDPELAIKGGEVTNLPNTVSILAYPNPFNSNVMLSLDLKEGGDIGIGIYDIIGRLVKTIKEEGYLNQGTYKFTWDATGTAGKSVSSGLYFARARASHNSQVLKLIYLK